MNECVDRRVDSGVEVTVDCQDTCENAWGTASSVAVTCFPLIVAFAQQTNSSTYINVVADNHERLGDTESFGERVCARLISRPTRTCVWCRGSGVTEAHGFPTRMTCPQPARTAATSRVRVSDIFSSQVLGVALTRTFTSRYPFSYRIQSRCLSTLSSPGPSASEVTPLAQHRERVADT